MRINTIFRAFGIVLTLSAVLLMSSACSLFGGSGSSSETEGTAKATDAASIRLLKVTVKCGDNKKSIAMSGGTVDQAVKRAGYNTEKYNVEPDLNTKVTDGMTITLTEKIQDGFVTEKGKTYYYINGEMQKNAVIGSEEEGFYYAGADGVIDYGYCDGINYNGSDWNVINGKASLAESNSDLMLNKALKAVAKCTKSSMTKQEKLKAAFDYIKTAYLEGVRHDPPYKELDWPIIYAEDIFVYGKGDCFSYGAAFAFMGKAIGCENCYACNSGGHGWAEIEGLVYDPEWDMHYPKYNHFAVDYDNNDTDVNYKKGIEPGADYMHVPV